MNALISLLQKNRWAPFAFWIFLSFLLYGSTLSHEFVLDDDLVIGLNKHVQKGVSGLSEIFAHSHTHGATGIEDAGYRPLPLTVFAILQSLFGKNPAMYHFISVLLYGLAVALLFKLLQVTSSKLTPAISLLITALFFVHPLHTEVVANAKGLEDILQFLLLMALLLQLRQYADGQKLIHLLGVMGFFALSLLSKEIAVSFIVLIPLYLYVFTDAKTKLMATATGGALVVLLLYMGLRQLTVGDAQEVTLTSLNNGLVAADGYSGQLATALWMQVRYLGLFLFPNALSYDYSLSHVPLVSAGSLRGIIGFVGALAIVAATAFGIWKRQLYGFGLGFYLITIALVSNLFFLIGSTMAERFTFTASVGLCIALVSIAYDKLPKKRHQLFNLLLLGAIVLLAGRTYVRNQDWKDAETLFTADVKSAPNSTRTHKNLGVLYLQQAQNARVQQVGAAALERAKRHLLVSIEKLPTNYESWYNLGVVENLYGNVDGAEQAFLSSVKHEPEYSLAYNNLGVIYFNRKQTNLAETNFRKAFELNPHSADVLANMGLVYYAKVELEEAVVYYEKALAVNPNHINALGNIVQAARKLGDQEKASMYEARLRNLTGPAR